MASAAARLPGPSPGSDSVCAQKGFHASNRKGWGFPEDKLGHFFKAEKGQNEEVKQTRNKGWLQTALPTCPWGDACAAHAVRDRGSLGEMLVAEDARAEPGSLGRPRSPGFSFPESCKPAAASWTPTAATGTTLFYSHPQQTLKDINACYNCNMKHRNSQQ